MMAQKSGVSRLAPVESNNLHQQVYDQLRGAIMAGHFRPGDRVTLRGLAAVLGTSIMPARDAVLRLVADHALESFGRSVRIPMRTVEQLRDVERYRVALEGEAAALAALRATKADLDAVQQANEQARKAQREGRAERFLVANQQFHFAIYRGAHSDLLMTMIETLWLQIGPHLGYVLSVMQGGDPFDVDMAPHDQLVAALLRRDPDQARAALAADLKDSTDIYAPLLHPEAVPTPVKRARAGT